MDLQAFGAILMHPSFAGFIGSLLSLRWAGPSWSERGFFLAGGMACALYVVPVLTQFMGIYSPIGKPAWALVAGLIGMNLCIKAVDWLKEADMPEIIDALSSLLGALKG